MTTKTTSNETKNQTSKQSTFAPLGKYAAIAVIMVGVIVTTAIMLDKQLNKAETEIASIESSIKSEMAELNKVQTNATKTIQPDSQVQVTSQPETTASASTTKVEIDTAEINATVNTDIANTPSSDVIATAETNVNSHVDSHQARIDSYKVQQRSRMTEMFNRINQLESKQLEQYKAQQAEQVARLRNQVSTQQGQIDALIQRNENLFELRSASMQRSQAQREQVLNRI